MFCTQCGVQLPAGSRFCPQCGTRVQSVGQVLRSTPAFTTRKVLAWLGVGCSVLLVLALVFVVNTASTMPENDGIGEATETGTAADPLPVPTLPPIQPEVQPSPANKATDRGSTEIPPNPGGEIVGKPSPLVPQPTPAESQLQLFPLPTEVVPTLIPSVHAVEPTVIPARSLASTPSVPTSIDVGEVVLHRNSAGNLTYRRPSDGKLFEEISYQFLSSDKDNITAEERDPRHQYTKTFDLRDGYFCYDASVGTGATRVEFWLGRAREYASGFTTWGGQRLVALGSRGGFASSTCLDVYDLREGKKVSRSGPDISDFGSVRSGTYNIKAFAIPSDANWKIAVCTRAVPHRIPDKPNLTTVDFLHCGVRGEATD